VKNKFSIGDLLELVTPSGNLRFSLPAMENLNGGAMDCAPGSGYIVRIPVPQNAPAQLVNSYLTRILPNGTQS
jgi:putative protease